MSTSWVAEIVFKSSTYKLIKYYYSENEGAFEINKDGITNKNGSFKYEIVDTQSGGKISFKKGDNTSSTYTKLFFVIYDGSTEFADNNMKVHECTSATDNGSYTYEGLNGNSLTSITFTNMKVEDSKLNAITGVVVPAAPAQTNQQAKSSAPETQVVPESLAAPAQTNQQAKSSAPVVEKIHEAVKTFKGVTLRNNKGTIQVYIPSGYNIGKYDIFFDTPISAATYRCIEKSPYDAADFDLFIDEKNKTHVYIEPTRKKKYEHKPKFQDMFHIKDNNNSLLTKAKIIDNTDKRYPRIVYGGFEVPSQTIPLLHTE